MNTDGVAVLLFLGVLLIGAARPTVLVAASLSSPWLAPAFAPEGRAAQSALALALLTLIAVGVSLQGNLSAGRAHVPPGLIALFLILAVASIESFFIESIGSFLILTLGASLPLAFVALYYADADSRSTRELALFLAYASAALPVGLLAGFISRDDLNPITIGNAAWAGMLLVIAVRSQMRFYVWIPLAVVSGVEWITTDQIGPRLAGAAAVSVFVLKQLQSGPVPPSERRAQLSRGKLVAATFGLVAVGVLAIREVLNERAQGAANNTTIREAGWRSAINDIQLIGGGVRDVELDLAGRALTFNSHNFLVDAASAVGIVGLILILFVTWKAIRGVIVGQHVLVPLCLGIMVSQLFSGGLFRSPTLWFALTLLMAIEAQSRTKGRPAKTIRTESHLRRHA